MKEKIDCLLIGNNQMDINQTAQRLEIGGKDSEPYRELNLFFLEHNNKKFHFGDMYNYVNERYNPNFRKKDYLDTGNCFCLSIAYLGTYLHRRNLTFNYVNSFQAEKDKLIDLLQSKEILTIAITTTLYTHFYPILEIVSLIKKYNHSAKIIVGGPFVANVVNYNQKTARVYFEKIGADIFVYSSQGETTLVNIINCLKHGDRLDKVKNIYFKQDKEILSTPIEIENNNLEHNMVDWQLFKNDLPALVNVRSAISCPFNCGFCGFPERAGKHYTVSVGAFEDELNSLRDTNVSSVYIVDDTFNIPKNRFKEILRMIIKNKYPFKWNSYFRCQFADRETLDLMAESGCEGVYLGLESGNQQLLDNMNKKVTLESYKKGLMLLREYDFLKIATFIIGYPGETEQTVNDTAAFLEEYGLDYVGLQLWYCDPITPVYRQKEQYKLEGTQFGWSHATMDSKTAMDLLYKLFMNVKNPASGPPLPLMSQTPFALFQKCKDFYRIKNAVKCFNDGIISKIQNPEEKNISASCFEKLRSSMLSLA